MDFLRSPYTSGMKLILPLKLLNKFMGDDWGLGIPQMDLRTIERVSLLEIAPFLLLSLGSKISKNLCVVRATNAFVSIF